MEWIFAIGLIALLFNPPLLAGVIVLSFLVVGAGFLISFFIAGNIVGLLLLGIPWAAVILITLAHS